MALSTTQSSWMTGLLMQLQHQIDLAPPRDVEPLNATVDP